MAIIISAPLGGGKTLLCMSEIDRISKSQPNRRIYTNIIGCTYPGVILIQSTTEKPFDWRDLPNGSVLIYDEAHEHPAFSKDDLLKTLEIDDSSFIRQIAEINSNQDLKVKEKEELVRQVRKKQDFALVKKKEDILDIGRSLTLHRHFGIEIYFITQKPERLNNSVRAAVTKHLILRRLFNLKMSTIYEFVELQDQFGYSTMKNALSWKVWIFPKTMYKFYISAEEHPQKTKVPFGLYGWALIALVIFGIAGNKVYQNGFFGLGGYHGQPKQQAANVEVNKQTSSTDKQTSAASDLKDNHQVLNKVDECRKAENVDKPECKAWFDDLSKNNLSVTQNGQVYKTVEYDATKPFSVNDIQYEYTVTTAPVFSGCIKFDGKYTAYTQQGTKLNVSQSDCKKIMNGDRPFNPFQQPQQQQQFTQDQQQPQQQYTLNQRAQIDQMQYEQRPHNNVQPNLSNDQRYANKGGGLANFS